MTCQPINKARYSKAIATPIFYEYNNKFNSQSLSVDNYFLIKDCTLKGHMKIWYKVTLKHIDLMVHNSSIPICWVKTDAFNQIRFLRVKQKIFQYLVTDILPLPKISQVDWPAWSQNTYTKSTSSSYVKFLLNSITVN